MDAWSFALAVLVLVVVLVLGSLSLRYFVAQAEGRAARAAEKAAQARRMAHLAKKSAAVRSKKKKGDDDEDEGDDDEEDEGDDIDQFFDIVDENPLMAGVAQGFAQKEGIDLEAVRRREPAALAKANAALQKLNAPQGAPAAAGGPFL